jgi:hypothetical protein
MVTVVHRSGTRSLDPRADSHLLLELARIRLGASGRPSGDGSGDELGEGSGEDADAEQGWVGREQFLDQFEDGGRTVEWLNTEIYRVRNRFRGLGVVDADRLIERRSSRPPRIRLRVRDIRIVRSDAEA